MSDQKKPDLLAMEISSAIHGSAFGRFAANLLSNSAARRLLVVSAALITILPGSAQALTIGELQVQSSLGQAFVATTTARLAPGETLAPGCVGAIADTPGGNAGTVRLNTTVAETATPGGYPVRLTSSVPLYEPMYEIQLKVNCPDIPVLVKTYVVMLNVGMANPLTQAATTPPAEVPTKTASALPVAEPARETQAKPVFAAAPDIQSATDNSNSTSKRAPAAPTRTTKSSIAISSKYRVQRGDTLLTIAQRVEGRAGLSARQFARILLQENPAAFIDGNPDLIKLGFVITVPGEQPLVSAPENGASNQGAPNSIAAGLAATGSTVSSNPASVPQPVRATQQPAPATVSVDKPPSPAVLADSIAVTANEQKPAVKDTEQNPAPERLLASSTLPDTGSVPDSAVAAQDSVSNLTGGQTAVSASDTMTAVTQTSDATKPADLAIATAAAIAPTSAVATAGPNQLLAAGSGMLVGTLLAALILGGRLIAARLPGLTKRSERVQETHPEQADTLIDADTPAARFSTAATSDALADQTAAETEDKPFPEFTEHADVDLGSGVAEDAGETAFAETETTEFAALENETQAESATPDIAGTDQAMTPENDAPRISLRDSSAPASHVDFDLSDMEEPLENTRRYSDPSMLAEDKPVVITEPAAPSELDGSTTMHNLFAASEAAAAEPDVTSTMHDIFADAPASVFDTAETEEIPKLGSRLGDNNFACVDIDNTSSLQAISESVLSGDADDTLSKTLTQALGLLEKDYEDELTNSQILEQKDIQKAFAEHAAKDS